jgi:hypothetical protein
MWQWGKLKHEFRLARRFLIGLRRSFIILRQIDHMGTALAIDRQIHNYLDKLNDKQKRAVLLSLKQWPTSKPLPGHLIFLNPTSKRSVNA